MEWAHSRTVIYDSTFTQPIMKIAVVGAGAIGGYLGVRLARSGEDVTFIARGANLAAIRAGGMKLILEDGSELRAEAKCSGHTSLPGS